MKKVYLLYTIIICAFSSVAQTNEALKITSVPPSPNAAHLAKYAEIPVNFSTGAANYNIPVYNISEGDLNWSLSLNYNYIGFKPSEGVSWVGRGWTLRAGGVITRTTQGIRDEAVNGYFSKGTMVATSLDEKVNSQTSTINIHDDASKGTIDGEPDLFYFNFGEYSGKFFYGIDGQPHIVSNRKIKIERLDANSTTEDVNHNPDHIIMKWTLTTEDGTIYIFDVREYTTSNYLSLDTDDGPSAWHLSEIISPSGKKLKFYYTTLGATNNTQTSYIEKGVSADCPNPADLKNCLASSANFTVEQGIRYDTFEERFLTKIESVSGYNQILFTSDVISIPIGDKISTSRRLLNIDLKNKYSDELIGSYEFGYDNTDKYALKSYGEVSKTAEKKSPFRFSYIREGLAYAIPGYTKSIDFWGYFNAANNSSLIPEKGANRIPNFEETATGALNKITHPSGGVTEFEYEQNEYSYVFGADVTGKQLSTKLYQYTLNHNQGIGNVGFTVSAESAYSIEYQCAKTTPTSQNCSGTCPWNNKYTCPTTKLQTGITYNINDFINSSILTEIGCADDLTIVAFVTVYKPGADNKRFGPGIRVKKVTSAESVASNTATVKEYFYNSISASAKSSGVLNREPLLSGVASFPIDGAGTLRSYNFYRTESITMLAGPSVIYEDVEERTNNTNKVIYKYSSHKDPYDDVNSYSYSQPFSSVGTVEHYDFTRGLLLSKKIYKGLTTTIVSQTDYTYVFQKTGGPGVTLGGYKTPSFYYELLAKAPDGNTGNYLNIGFGKFYLTAAGWLKKTSETTVVKDMDGNNPLTTTINYTYEASNPKHFQVVQSSTLKSDGSSSETINKYPLDYESVSPKQSFITEMIASNIVKPVIEQQKWINRGGTRTLVGLNLNYFKSLDVNTLQGYSSGNTDLFPKEKIVVADKQYIFYSNQPIDETTANTKLFTGYTFDNSIYREKFNYANFDAKGNLRQQIHLDSDNTAYLWGYKGMYIVAEIKNCTTSALETALTSIGSSVAEIYNLEDDATIQAKMNALRAALPGSLITSYTYKPLIGIISETDPSGNRTRYEYDSFNRLKEVYNTNNKLVKSYKYGEVNNGAQTTRPAKPIFAGNTILCKGSSTTLTVSNCNGQVIWDNGVYTGQERIIIPASTTTYSAICLNSENVASDLAVVTINVSDKPLIASVTSNSPVGQGETLTFTLNSSGSTTYNWAGPENFVSTLSNPTIPNAGINAGGLYTVTVGVSGACTATATIAVIVTSSCECTVCNDITDANYTAYPTPTDLTISSNKNYIEERTYLTDDGLQFAQSISYFDGLGRPIEKVSRKTGADGKDVISFMEYDPLGREKFKYLPYTANHSLTNALPSLTTHKTALAAFYNTQTGKESDKDFAFAETIFENSSLSRVLQQGSAGAKWQPKTDPLATDNHAVKMVYTTNKKNGSTTTIDDKLVNDIKLFSINSITNEITTQTVNISIYEANQLFINITIDENGNRIAEIKTKEGQVICKRVQNKTNDFIETNYVFDDYGLLRFVFQPMATQYLTGTTLTPLDNASAIKELTFAYSYDERGRMIQKKVPDAAVVEMVYDNGDRLVLTQDAWGRANNRDRWVYTDYDQLRRPIESGFLTNSDSRTTLQSTYSQNNAPTGTKTYLTKNTYDDYPTGDEALFAASDTYGQSKLSNVKGMATKTETRIVSVDETHALSTNIVTNVTFYDNKARIIKNVGTNHTGGTDINITKIDFVGRAIKSKLISNYKKDVSTTETRTLETKNSYDAGGRPQSICQKIDTDNWERVNKNTYSALGELKTKELGCDNSTGNPLALQNVDYVNNIRGWLTSINGVENTDLQTNKDLFGMRLTFDGTNTANDNTEVSNTFFNGNIVKQEWNTLKNTTTGTTASGKQTYDYKYDRLNRLMEANFTGSLAEGISVKMYDATNPLRNYDLNGNIGYLKRSKAGDTTPMDELIYSYTANQLNKVDDSGDANQLFKDKTNTTDYLYDEAGNMKEDKNKDITLQYNYLNLPGTITRTNSTINNGTIRHYYAGSSKVRMEIYESNGTTLKKAYDYVAGMVYIEEVVSNISTKTLDFVPSPEGRALLTRKILNTPTDPTTGDKFRFEYSLKDHLGNLRVSCRCGEPKRDAIGTIIPEGTVGAGIEALAIVQENHYDPWGLSFGATTEAQNPANLTNKFDYNGKEKLSDLDLGWNDYGARMYMSEIGRWNGVDPLAEKMRRSSPYLYTANNPIRYIDPDGMEWKDPNDKKIADRLQQGIADRLKVENANLEDENKTIAKLEAKIAKDGTSKGLENRLKTAKDRASSITTTISDLNSSSSELSEMETTKSQKFTFKELASGLTVGVTEKGKDGIITMAIVAGGDANAIHEAAHGFQFFKGSVSSDRLEREVTPYQRQYSFNTSSLPPSDWGSVKSRDDINANWVLGIPDEKGGYLYAPGAKGSDIRQILNNNRKKQ